MECKWTKKIETQKITSKFFVQENSRLLHFLSLEPSVYVTSIILGTYCSLSTGADERPYLSTENEESLGMFQLSDAYLPCSLNCARESVCGWSIFRFVALGVSYWKEGVAVDDKSLEVSLSLSRIWFSSCWICFFSCNLATVQIVIH